jgi:hypothetical protein
MRRRLAGDRVVEAQPIGKRLLVLAVALPEDREAGEVRGVVLRNRHCDQHRIGAGIGDDKQAGNLVHDQIGHGTPLSNLEMLWRNERNYRVFIAGL